MPLEYEFRLYYGLWRASCCSCLWEAFELSLRGWLAAWARMWSLWVRTGASCDDDDDDDDVLQVVMDGTGQKKDRQADFIHNKYETSSPDFYVLACRSCCSSKLSPSPWPSRASQSASEHHRRWERSRGAPATYRSGALDQTASLVHIHTKNHPMNELQDHKTWWCRAKEKRRRRLQGKIRSKFPIWHSFCWGMSVRRKGANYKYVHKMGWTQPSRHHRHRDRQTQFRV